MDRGRLEDLFDAARHLRRAEREAFLERECGEDAELRAELDSLLEGTDSDPGFLETPAPARSPELARRLGAVERVGSYRLLRLLGEGGMGVVFLAEQDSPRREVALKIVHPAFLSARSAERLAREGEALGRLQHPAIAGVIEVGEAQGPFDVPLTFVAMERLHGEAITVAADRLGLDVRARLERVAEVADAVQHAHERGVVHRDLKPSNVLLSDDGRPHVLDFGVARILDGRFEELTASGQAVGTPSHMAPEQVAGGAGAASPLVDVYALGGLAYELLAGRPPLALEGRSPAEFLQAVAWEDPPPLRSLARGIDRDVETIVHTALAREPQRRYASAGDLAADLRRYLRDEPIRARPPSVVYRIAKLARRRRTAVVAVALVLAIGGIATGLVLRGREQTAARADQVRRLLGMLEARLDESDPFRGGELSAEQEASLAEAEGMVERELAGHPRLAAEMLVVLARIRRNRGDAESGERIARRALELCAGDGVEAALAHSELALSLSAARRFKEAEGHFRAALERLAELGPAYREELLGAKHNLALCLKDQGRYDEAEAMYRGCLAERLELLGPDHVSTSATRSNLARLLQDSGRDLEGAVELLRASAGSDARTQGPDAPYTLVTRSQLAGALRAAGRAEEARDVLVPVVDRLGSQLGPDHPDTLAARRNLAQAYEALGDVQRTRTVLEGMLPDMQSCFGEVDHRTLEILGRLARAYTAEKSWEDAKPAWEEVERVAGELHGERHAAALSASVERAAMLRAAGELEGARAVLGAALERAASLPEGDPARTAVERAAVALESP